MPGRITPLVNNQIYHVFNRGTNHQPTYLDKLEYKRAKLVIDFYKFSNLPTRLSKFLTLSNDDRAKIMDNLKKDNDKLVDILSFCLMPNHINGVIEIGETVGQSRPPLQKIIQGFKSVTTRMCFKYGYRIIWQRVS